MAHGGAPLWLRLGCPFGFSKGWSKSLRDEGTGGGAESRMVLWGDGPSPSLVGSFFPTIFKNPFPYLKGGEFVFGVELKMIRNETTKSSPQSQGSALPRRQ